MKDSYLELGFNATHRDGAHARYADGDLIKLVTLGLIAFFSKYKRTSSCGSGTEEMDNAHVICLLHKLISSSRDSDDLSIVFHISIEAQEKDMTNNKTITGNYHVRIYSKDVFGFAKYQDKCTSGLGYKPALP